MPTIRTFDGQFLIAKQSAKGSAASSNFHKFRRTDGRIQVNKDIASVNYIDGNSWGGDDFDFTKSISGSGSITLQVTPEGAARLAHWALSGTDTVTGTANPYTHTISNGDGITYLTIVDSLGKSGDLQDARKWTDAVITQLELTSSHDSGVVTAKVDFIACDHTLITSLPSATTTDGEPLLHTQGTGSINIAGLNGGNGLAEVEQFVLTIDTNAELLYGDSVSPYIVHKKRGAISWSATVSTTNETIKALYQHLYGSASPSNNSQANTSIFKAGFNPVLTQSANRSLEVNIPTNRVIVDQLPDPNAAGDHTTLSIAGVARTPNSGSLITVVAETGDSSAY